eukprot:UN02209
MSQQLFELTKHASDVEINQLNQSNQLSQQIFIPSKLNKMDRDESLPNSSLYRDAGKDRWKKQLVDKEKQEMAKQMMHLASQGFHTIPSTSVDEFETKKEEIVKEVVWNSDYSDNDAVPYIDHFDDD